MQCRLRELMMPALLRKYYTILTARLTKTKKFNGKTEYLILKAYCNKDKIPSVNT